MEKVKKLIDAAFKQSLELVCERFELNPEQVHLLIQFFGRQIRLTVFRDKDAVRMIPFASIIGSKMVALRLTAKQIGSMFRSVEFAMGEDDSVSEGLSDVSLVMYNSKKLEKPCLGIYVNEKPLKVIAVSDVMEVLKIGTEQIN